MIRVFGRAVFAMMVVVAAFCGTVRVKASNNHCEYWVAPSPYGDDTNPGTSDMPWATR
jgi:hypothetical protein